MSAEEDKPVDGDEGDEIDDAIDEEFDDNKALCARITDAHKTYGFFPRGLVITTKKSMFARKRRLVLAWDSLRKCDMDWECFKGTLQIRVGTGRVVVINSWSWKIKAAAQVVHDMMNPGEDQVDAERDQTLAKVRGKTRILNHGIILRKTNYFTCSGMSSFIPWESVVSASLLTGCFKSYIHVSTILEHTDNTNAKPPPTKEKPKQKPKPKDPAKTEPLSEEEKLKLEEEAEAAAAAIPPPPSYVSVTLMGAAGHIDDVFKVLRQLMDGDKEEDKEIEDAPNIYRTKLYESGVLDTQGMCFPQVHFIPWRAITSVDWAADCCKAPQLILTDRVGNQRALLKVSQDKYLKFRSIFNYQVGQTWGEDGDVKPIVRRNLRIMADGVAVTKRQGCSSTTRFYPWSIVDAAEMDLTCCGGTLLLITEAGERISVWSASIFTRGRMMEIYNRIREMKYESSQDENDGNPRYFAGREGHPKACVLTDKTLRIVSKAGSCMSRVRLIDLDAVVACKVIKGKGCMAKWTLHVYLNEKMMVGMDSEEVKRSGAHNELAHEEDDHFHDHSLQVMLRRNDPPEDIRADIMNRQAKRKATLY